MIWIEQEWALEIHIDQLTTYGGAHGIRDLALLESALSKPNNKHYYENCQSLPELAAAYIAGIVKNHPFIDGNKRTGFAVGATFLLVNGVALTATWEKSTEAILSVASGLFGEPELANWIAANTQDLS